MIQGTDTSPAILAAATAPQSLERPSTTFAATAPPVAAVGVTALLMLSIYLGSDRLRHLDHALVGYLAATLVACFGLTFRVVAFWCRKPSAFFGRILLAALWQGRTTLSLAEAGGRDLVAQNFLRKRNWARWLAHMAMSWGTLMAFSVTLPLVWGWMRFEAVGERHYAALFVGASTMRFATDELIGWVIFHALSIAAVLVLGGCFYFVRLRWSQNAAGPRHMAPLILLISVATSGLLLLPAAQSPVLWVFPLVQWVHQISVVVLLLALPYSKLIHLFIRPLHIGVQLQRAAQPPAKSCESCAEAIVADAQFALVQATLLERGFRFADYQSLCPSCRRRNLARNHSALAGARFLVS